VIEAPMKQLSLAESAYVKKPKTTRKQVFLAEMDQVTPWAPLCAVIEPFYPKAGNGRQPMLLETMLRIHFMQQWFALSDPAMEEALHDIPVMRAFAGIDAGQDAIPDETTLLHFRHLLEAHGLAARLFAEVNALLGQRGLMLKQGSLVDATLIAAPSSTKNRQGQRDPEMHQTRKGQQWYPSTSLRTGFGCKAHIGVDAESGLTHSVITTAANVSDVTQTHRLLHGQETDVFADAGYTGVDKRKALLQCKATWHVAMKPGRRRALPDTPWGRLLRDIEQAKAAIRAKVEHPFRVIKRQFGYTKVRYRGLAKNGAQIVTLFGLANLFQARRSLLAVAQVRP
jgi:transposase, IS5 family